MIYSHQFPTDFKNPDDPDDKSFQPHPTDYPVVELEYPNTGASEKYAYSLYRRLLSHIRHASGSSYCNRKTLIITTL